MKITEAISNVITEAGGTPTQADADSVTHALGTLYTALGGTDALPNDVAERINSLSDHIGGGGGGGSFKTCTIHVNNQMATPASTNGYVYLDAMHVEDGKIVYVNNIYVKPSESKDYVNVLVVDFEDGEEYHPFVHFSVKNSKYKTSTITATSANDSEAYATTFGSTNNAAGMEFQFHYTSDVADGDTITVTVQ